MITIWGRTTSSNVQTVMWAIAELGLEHERIDAGGPFGGLDTPEFAAMNPNRLVPVLRDGGEYLWESASIVRYGMPTAMRTTTTTTTRSHHRRHSRT